MTNKFIISFICVSLLSLFTCENTGRIKKLEKFNQDLPFIDSTDFVQCAVKYKNDLYDNNSFLLFKLNVVYIMPLSLANVIESNELKDSTIATVLNTAFKSQGIGFEIYQTSTSYADLSLNEFAYHYQEYEEKDMLTILVYKPSEDARYSGIAAGIPSVILGISEDKIGTSTLPHEAGHALGLKHIFEKDDTDGKNSHSGDNICDTGSFNIMDNKTVGCAYIGKPLYSKEDLEILIPNYLNYNSEPIDCRDTFTPIQILAIRWHIENYPALYSALVY